MRYLDRHMMQCNEPGGVMAMFHLERNVELIRYQYKCCKIDRANTCYPQRRTSVYSDDGSGQAIYLDRHAADCGTTGFISDFRVERNPNQGHIRYNYNCCMLTSKWSALTSCYDAYTSFSYDGNGRVYYLDRQIVQCNSGFALSYFRMQRNYALGQYRYHYRCCKVNHR